MMHRECEKGPGCHVSEGATSWERGAPALRYQSKSRPTSDEPDSLRFTPFNHRGVAITHRSCEAYPGHGHPTSKHKIPNSAKNSPPISQAQNPKKRGVPTIPEAKRHETGQFRMIPKSQRSLRHFTISCARFGQAGAGAGQK